MFWDEQVVCRKCEGTTTGLASPAQIVSPEADGVGATKPLRVQQVTWSSPATSRLLFDAGFGTTYYGWGNFERDGNPTRALVRVSEQCAGGCAANGGVPGIFYRSQDWNDNYTGAYPWRASVSYVTGAHSLKFGHTGTYFTDNRTSYTNDQQLRFRVNNGVPNQITEAVPFTQLARASILAFYGQEQWTLGRLTLQGGIRYDRARGWFPQQTIGPTKFFPNPVIYPEQGGVDAYTDWTPRVGLAADVFGNGKTALKVSLGKYLEGASTGNPVVFYNTNPVLRLPNTNPAFGPLGVQRTWTDANTNFKPDCDLTNTLEQDLRGAGGDFCGQISDLAFGTGTLTNSFDPDLTSGSGVRPRDWSFSVSVQQQILSRASIEVAYSRRWFGGFSVVDNQLAQASDYTSYSITAPQDSRLPNGGGQVISGLYDIAPSLFGRVNNLTTLASKYGSWSQNFNGVDITLSVRTRNGMTFQGGTSTGQNFADACDVRSNLPELNAGIGGGLVGSAVSTDESVLSRCLRCLDAGTWARVVHGPEDRHPGQRGVPEQAGSVACCELCRAGRRHCSVARPSAIGERDQRHDQRGPARHAVRRSDQPARFPSGQASEVQRQTRDDCARSVQRDELQSGPHLQPDVQSDGVDRLGFLAVAEVDSDGAVVPDQRGVQLLTSFRKHAAVRPLEPDGRVLTVFAGLWVLPVRSRRLMRYTRSGLMTPKFLRATGAALAVIVLCPAVGLAQSGVAGVVRDTSGAVLPGVTVEAASPALIEKVRSAVTDSDGNYRILDLRPGLYAVTFTLSGFTTLKREGIELPAAFTATVNADLQVGTVTETITVSGATPLVDVQNVTSQRLLSKDLLESIPAARSPQGFAALTPGITSQGISVTPGGVNEMQTAVHGSSVSEAIWQIDGLSTAASDSVGGGNNTFRIAQVYVGELTVATGGGTAEQQFSGMVTNVIPKEGGNGFNGSLYFDVADEALSANNLTDELVAQGFTNESLSKISRLWDVSPAFGGRLVRDKLWFFASGRTFGIVQTRAGIYDNATPLGWVYTPDRNRQAFIKVTNVSRNARLTWQATPRNKFSFFVDSAPHAFWQHGAHNPPPPSPEGTYYRAYVPQPFVVGSWKSPLTNRWLFDAGTWYTIQGFDGQRQTPEHCMCSAPAIGLDVISATESTTGMVLRAAPAYGQGKLRYCLSVRRQRLYVTGAHAIKIGGRIKTGSMLVTVEPNRSLNYRLRNGSPISLTQYATPLQRDYDLDADAGLFAQDQWTFKRLTLTGGVRYDYLHESSPEQHLGAGLWVPARDFPVSTMARFNDVSVRMGVAYDLFGDGKTAFKASVGRYVAFEGLNASESGNANNHPVARSVQTVTRTWNDLNRDYNPDCELGDSRANGECGQISDLNFGQNNPNATRYADEVVTGLRGSNWETTAQIQRELMTGVSVTLAYYHKTFSNFRANDNQFVTPADFSEYCITAPVDSRLPDGGGYRICGLYDVNPALFGRNQTVVSASSNYGNQSAIYDGIDLTESIRLPRGATISGGLNWGRTETSRCFVVDSPEEMRFCEVAPPMRPTATFAGFVPLPWGLVSSATYRNYPGPHITATLTVPNSEIAPSLGRNLSSGVNGTVNVELIQPGTMYGNNAQQLDVRLSKRFRFNRYRIMANVDVFNIFNASGPMPAAVRPGCRRH